MDSQKAPHTDFNGRDGWCDEGGRFETVIDILARRAEQTPDRPALIFLGGRDAPDPQTGISYGALYRRVLGAGGFLSKRIPARSCLVLAVPTSPEAVIAFLGALAADLVPCILPVPRHGRDRGAMTRIRGVLQSLDTAWLASTPEGLRHLEGLDHPVRRTIPLDDAFGQEAVSGWRPAEAGPDTLACLQFTSGTTRAPKGVMLTHGAIQANMKAIADTMITGDISSALSWLPLHHDMGLFGHVFQPLFSGLSSYLASPAWFARDPLTWLRAITRYRIGITGGPPFAYERLIKRLDALDPADPVRSSLDLSCWKTAYLGAEPIAFGLLTRLQDRLRLLGLPEDALMATYGLAENVLLAAGRRLSGTRGGSLSYVPCPGADIRICDHETGERLEEGRRGEIQLAGSSLTSGFYGDREVTESLLVAAEGRTWLKTGDVGMLTKGRLLVTGRLRNMIIVRGVNHHAEDIAVAVKEHAAGLAAAAIAAFAVDGEEGEALVLAVEAKMADEEAAVCRSRIQTVLADHCDIKADEIVFVPQGFLARTTSGKLRHGQIREDYLAGRLTRAVRKSPASPKAASVPRREAGVSGPVAIVGLACRFPGADTPHAFWHRLAAGEDLVSDIPPERWALEDYFDPTPATPGKINCRTGGFISDVDHFDAAFFGIGPLEARAMDPQQRLALSVAWRALEDAGVPADSLAGSRTGVFLGLSTNDYLQLQISRSEAVETVNAWAGLGTAASIAANRISYQFDLRGPSVAVDTACSSSLTAVHLAMRALRAGDCDMALAGGVNLILSPGTSVALSQFGMLSSAGHCQVFDEKADGYVRAEGCGLAVLKPLAKAQADGDHIHAVIRGSAMAQDGHSHGITAPNRDAQDALIRAALSDAGTRPGEVSFVEAHGTGTRLGDPVEMLTLRDIYGKATGSTCLVGSVKASTGHLEAAAGIASLVKTVMALKHGQVPPQLHLTDLTHAEEVRGSRLKFPTRLEAWMTHGNRARVAAISSFGFGGALVHLIVEEGRPQAEPQPQPQPQTRPQSRADETQAPRPCDAPSLVTMSARDPESLKDYSENLARYAAETGCRHDLLAHALATGRMHMRCRRAIVTGPGEDLAKMLAMPPGEARTGGTATEPRVALLFPGQGGHIAGAGAALATRFPVFRDAVEDACDAFDAARDMLRPASGRLDGDLRSLLFERNNETLSHPAWAQPGLLAISHATDKLWRHLGVRPVAVMGHSLGEIAAAVAAGALSLRDAMGLTVARGLGMAALQEHGGMLGVACSARELEPLLEQWGLDRVVVGADNGPRSSALSGPVPALATAAEKLADMGVASKRLKTAMAFHSPLLEPMLPSLEAVAERFSGSAAAPAIPFISTLTGRAVDGPLSSGHWRDHARAPVLFRTALEELAALGFSHALEAGPGSVLSGLARAQSDCDGILPSLPSLTVGADSADEVRVFLKTAGRLYEDGLDLSLKEPTGLVTPAPPVGRVPDGLPGHPFRTRRFWFDDPDDPAETDVATGDDLHWHTEWRAAGWPEPPAALAARVAGEKDRHWIVLGDGPEDPEEPGGTAQRFGAALAERIAATGRTVFHFSRHMPRKSVTRVKGGIVRTFALPEGVEAEPLAKQLVTVMKRHARTDAQHWRLVYVDAPCMEKDAVTVDSLNRDQACFGPGFLVTLTAAIHRAGVPGQLWLATSGAVAVRDEDPVAVAQAPVWGLGVTLYLEHPELRGGMIDLDPAAAGDGFASWCDTLLAAIAASSDIPLQARTLAAVRGGERYVPRLVRSDAISGPGVAGEPLAVRADATVLITGGFGGLGLKMAEWLSEKGAGRVVLMGRTVPPETGTDSDTRTGAAPTMDGGRLEHIRAVVADMESRGTQVAFLQCDMTDSAALAEALRGIAADQGRPLAGLVHCAGQNWLAKVTDTDPEALLDTMKLNVAAAWQLDRATRDLDLDFFILFSSVSATWGSTQLGHYTAANRFLGALAHERVRAGLPATSIDFGPWADVGMSAKDWETEIVTAIGLPLIEPATALEATQRAVVSGVPSSLLARIDWDRFKAFADYSLCPDFFSEARAGATSGQGGHTTPKDFMRTLAALPQDEARATLAEAITKILAGIIYTPTGQDIGLHDRFNMLGMDSLTAINFGMRLEDLTGIVLEATIAYTHPTVADLTEYLLEIAVGAADHAATDPVIDTGSDTGPDTATGTGIRADQDDALAKNAPGSDRDWFLTGPESKSESGPASCRVYSGAEDRPVLYCLPYAGASAMVYADWQARLSTGALAAPVSVVPVELPGRGRLTDMAQPDSLDDLAAALAAAIAARGPAEHAVLFGHSFGARLAFATARALAGSDALPAGLVLSCCAPSMAPDREAGPVSDMDDTALHRHAYDRLGLSVGFGPDAPEWKRIARLLRSDLALLETDHPLDHPPIDTRALVMGGTADGFAPPGRLTDWSACFRQPVDIHLMATGHMPFRDKADAFFARLRGFLAERG